MPGRSVRIGGVYADFRARNQQFLAASRQNANALRRQNQAARTLNATGRRLTQTFSNISRVAFAGFGTVALAGVGAGIASLGRESAQLGATLVETSRQIGISTERLQLFGRVVEGDGVSVRDFENSLRQLARRLGEASLGEGEYVEAFERLGIALRDATGATRDVGDVFLQAADAIAALPTQADRAIAAYELFGRQGIRLLPILQQGSAAIQESAEAFRQFGILTADQSVRLKALEQSYTNTGTVIRTSVAAITADNAELFNSFNRLAQAAGPAAFGALVNSLDFLRRNMALVRAAASLTVIALLRWAGVFRIVAAAAVALRATLAGLATGAIAFSAALSGVRGALIRTGFGIAVVAAGELIFQFNRLVRATGGVGEAFRLLGAAIGEAFAGILQVVQADIGFNLVRIFQAIFLDILSVARDFAVSLVNTINRAVNQGIEALNTIPGIQIPIVPLLDRPNVQLRITGELSEIGRNAKSAFEDAFRGPTPALDRLRESIARVDDSVMSSIDQLAQYTEINAANLDRVVQNAATAASANAETINDVATNTISTSQRIAENAANSISNAVASAATGMQSAGDAARQVVFGVINDILQQLIRSQVLNLLGGIGFGGGGGLAGLFGGFRQFGGPVRAGLPYVVGETGPELFVPGQNGQIVPNGQMGGTVVNFAPVIQVQDRRAVDQALAEAFPIFEDRIRSGIITDRNRPSPFRG